MPVEAVREDKLDRILRIVEPLSEAAAKTPLGSTVFVSALTSLLICALVLGYHEVTGAENLREQNRRIDRLEDRQQRILLNVEAIAVAVDARVLPMRQTQR